MTHALFPRQNVTNEQFRQMGVSVVQRNPQLVGGTPEQRNQRPETTPATRSTAAANRTGFNFNTRTRRTDLHHKSRLVLHTPHYQRIGRTESAIIRAVCSGTSPTAVIKHPSRVVV